MTSATADPIEFDPVSEEFFADPVQTLDTYRRLRDEAPVYFSERYGFYALSRYEDALHAHRDPATFSSSHGVRLSDLLNPDYANRSGMISMDPPEHDRMRKLVSRVFTPRAISGLEPEVRAIITGFLDPLVGRDRFDIVEDFATLFPIHVISLLLGVPSEDRDQLRRWFDLILHREPGNPSFTAAGVEAYKLAHDYFYELARERRQRPADDMMTHLTMVTVERDDGGTTQLTDAELSDFGVLLGGAGAETVTKLIGSGVVLFAQNPDQWQKVLENPARIPGAVEEVLRCFPPSEYQGRYTRRSVTLHGTTIPPDSPLLILTRAANHDERAFTDPERFEIERDQHVSIGFGHGIHSCIGAALARLESRISFEEITRRWPHAEVDIDNCRRVSAANVTGYSNVPMVATG
jgi:cytochrome P450